MNGSKPSQSSGPVAIWAVIHWSRDPERPEMFDFEAFDLTLIPFAIPAGTLSAEDTERGNRSGFEWFEDTFKESFPNGLLRPEGPEWLEKTKGHDEGLLYVSAVGEVHGSVDYWGEYDEDFEFERWDEEVVTDPKILALYI